MEKLDGGVEVAGAGEGENEGTLDTAAAEAAVPNVVAEPRSYTNHEVGDMTSDQGHAAARGLLTVPQMQRLLGGPPLSTKELPR